MKKLITLGAVLMVSFMILSCSQDLTAPSTEDNYNEEGIPLPDNPDVDVVYGWVYDEEGENGVHATVELYGQDLEEPLDYCNTNEYYYYEMDLTDGNHDYSLKCIPQSIKYKMQCKQFYYNGGGDVRVNFYLEER